MPAITVRKLSTETHRALKQRAAEHGCSIEAEVRTILDQAVRPPQRVRLGSALRAIGRELDVTTEFDVERDSTPAVAGVAAFD